MAPPIYYCRNERRKESLKRSIRQKRNSLKRLESRHDQLYEAFEKTIQTDVQSSLKLSQWCQPMVNDAVRQVRMN